MENTILDGIKVLDLTSGYGTFCARLMADMGADVVMVEPFCGSKTRDIGPFYHGQQDLESSLYHACYNAGKKSVVMDLNDNRGKDQFLMLIQNADVVLDDGGDDWTNAIGISREELRHILPGLILCSISPFGSKGPYAKWKASSELIPFALAGPMYETGDPDNSPLWLGEHFLSDGASLYALTAIIATLIRKEKTGEGDEIEVSLFDIAGAWRGLALGEVQQVPDHKIARRSGSQGLMIPSNFYACRDGYVFMMASGRWPQVVQWMKDRNIDVGDKDDEKYIPDQGFNRYLWKEVDEVNRLIGVLASGYTKQEMMEEGQRRRVPVGAAETTLTVLNNPQYLERNYFIELMHPIIGKAKYPGAAFGFSKTPMGPHAAAPLLGENTQEVKELWLRSFKKESQRVSGNNKNQEKPLSGIVVLDLGWVVAGPHGARILRELGATVIRIESSTRVDPMRIDTMRNGVKDCMQEGGWGFQENSRSKLGMSLNLKSEEGKKIFYELVEKADVVTCNFAPNGFHRMGIDYDTLHKLNEKIIVVNASGLGDDGPYGGYMTFAPVLASMTSIISIMGYEGKPPFGYPGLLADYMGGISLAAAVAGALFYRERTGEGQFVDLSQAEATMQSMGPLLLAQQLNGETAEPVGNHHRARQIVPHNCYECRDEDTWCVICAATDAEWQNLVNALRSECPDLADERFSILPGRVAGEKEIDEILAKYFKSQDHRDIVFRLQEAGVSAGVVQNTHELLYDDIHAHKTHYFRKISFSADDDIEPKDIFLTGPLVHLSSAKEEEYCPGPPCGQDNDWILREYLCKSDEEIRRAEEDQAFL